MTASPVRRTVHRCATATAGVAARIAAGVAAGVALAVTAAAAPGPVSAQGPAAPQYAPVAAGHALAFPADFGSHPQFRTEWWYVTGWLTSERGEPLGFQITFFRTRPDIDQGNPSSFTPRQILIAHCAISDPARGRLWQDQRVRRAGFGLAEALVADTHVWLDDWTLEHAGSAYTARIAAEDFSLDLRLSESQAVLLNGDSGVSRKGPAPGAASYYYSVPHLKVSGSIGRQRRTDRVSGEAWLDHEWSSEVLDAGAVGWDWVGVNLDDGAALMAFRIRDSTGGQRWAGGSLRDSGGKIRILQPADIAFRAGRRWVSPRTGIGYPVEWSIRAGDRQIDLEPLMDDQENDTRLSTGAIYWEGAVRAYEKRRLVGRGYLELTGYGEALRLR